MGKKVALLGCKGTTLDMLSDFTRRTGVQISQVITLPSNLGRRNNVAFFRGNEIRQHCKETGTACYTVNSYSLNDNEDITFFQNAGIDLLLVIGWERLLPDLVLSSLGLFACGMHGSPYGLPKGRGRSPMNWSLIDGHELFLSSLFRYTPGTDDGNIIGSRMFEINEFDTIATLHLKNRICMTDLLVTYLPNILRGQHHETPQPPTLPTFFPKRTKDDGRIDWRQTTKQIYNLIRAVASPYPGARTSVNGREVIIWEAIPFSRAIFPGHYKEGQILDVSVAGECFVVSTGDGSLLIQRFEGISVKNLEPERNLTCRQCDKFCE